MEYMCAICGFVYDEAKGIPEDGIPPGTKWEDLPAGWSCPRCGAPKSAFEPKKSASASAPAPAPKPAPSPEHHRKLNAGEFSALCSNLARGCEKQYLTEEAALFTELSESTPSSGRI